MALLHVEIVVVNLQAETNLLDFRGALVAASFTSLDLLVVLELAVINELGDRRLRVRGHLDEIEVCLLGQVQRDGSRDDAHLRADQAYLRDANLVVNTWFVADDDSNPLLQFRGEGLCWSPVQCFGFMASQSPRQYALSFCRRISVLCVIPDYALYIAIARLFALNPRP